MGKIHLAGLIPVLFLLGIILVVMQAGCAQDDCDSCSQSDDDDTADDDDNDNDTGDDDDDTAPPVDVIVEYLMLDGVPAPPNPATGAQTPPELDKIPLFRYRQDTGDDPSRPVRAVLILLPGFLAGASDFTFLAPDMVRLFEGAMEVWVPDRRSHLLEDQTGSLAAEAEKDPWIFYDYYFEGGQIDGKVFEGPIPAQSAETDMMSEWGLDLYLNDIRRIIHHVPEAHRATNVLIGGHSRGVGYAQLYAAYEFEDGTLGSDELAGLMMLDGGREWDRHLTDNLYRTRVQLIRSGLADRHHYNPFPGKDLPSLLQFLGMASTEGFGDPEDPETGPDGVLHDRGVIGLLMPFLTRFHQVTLTNEALVGLIFDNDSSLLGTYMGHLGQLTGGEVAFDLWGAYPAEHGILYSWLNFDESEPQELADIQKLMQIIYAGPLDGLNLYTTTRFDLDDQAAGPMETEGTWRHDHFHFYTSRVDIPVFAVKGALMYENKYFEAYRSQLAPVRGHEAPRTQVGFDIIPVPTWGHVETLLVEADRNIYYPLFVDWVDLWTGDEVQIPAFGQ